jgi:hypothetical protein
MTEPQLSTVYEMTDLSKSIARCTPSAVLIGTNPCEDEGCLVW